jgi:Zn-dependent protease with chaperone function
MIRPISIFLIATLLILWGMREIGIRLGFAEHINAIDIAGIVMILFLSPVIFSFILPARKMQDFELLDSVMFVAKKAGVRLSSVLVWNTNGRFMNAMAVGVLPSLKTIIVTDKLVTTLTRKEFLAVTMHEVGHHRYWHIPFLWLTVISVLLCSDRVFEHMISIESWYISLAKLPIVAIVVVMVSRKFERQADVYAASYISTTQESETITHEASGMMSSALSTIANTHHISPLRRDFLHGSIASRQSYLNGVIGSPIASLSINRIVMWIKVFIIASIVLVIVA